MLSGLRTRKSILGCGRLSSIHKINSDRDAKQRWANSVVGSGWGLGLGGIGGQILTGAVKRSVGRVFT